MIKLLYLNGDIRRTRIGHSLRHMTHKDGSRPLVIEYDEVDWEAMYERMSPEGMVHWWETHVSGCLEEGVKVNPPTKLQNFMYKRKDEEEMFMYFQNFRPKNPSLVKFWHCDCGNIIITGSDCPCGVTNDKMETIPEVVGNMTSSSDTNEAYMKAVANKANAVKSVEDRSTECVGCQ